MYTLNIPKESEETIFIQAIDQIYEINKNYSDSSEDESNEDFENGEIKINFDFINFSDESSLKSNKSDLKNSEANLFNSSLSSESTEFDSLNASRYLSDKFLTEQKGVKIKDYLAKKLSSNSKLDLEIVKLKDNIRSNLEFGDKLNKIKTLPLKAFENNHTYFNSNASNNTINNFNFNYNCNFPSSSQQNIGCTNFIYMPQQSRNTSFNSLYNHFQVGFFQQTNLNNNQYNHKIESSIFGLNVNHRKNSYPVGSNL